MREFWHTTGCDVQLMTLPGADSTRTLHGIPQFHICADCEQVHFCHSL